MNDIKLVEQAYIMQTTLNSLSQEGTDKLSGILSNEGLTNEDIEDAVGFLIKSIAPIYHDKKEDVMISLYLRALSNVRGCIKMQEGYKEMGEINLEISEEMLHTENE